MSRKAKIARSTAETAVEVEIDLDGSGEGKVDTGIPLFDHFLSQLIRHGLLDARISASGGDKHHLIEDVAICLGRALDQALGERRGINRLSHALVPMDDAFVLVALDLGGRGFSQVEAPEIREFPQGMLSHFLRTLAFEAKMGVHTKILAGENEHHKGEALFKALGRAIKIAAEPEPRLKNKFPSTKELID